MSSFFSEASWHRDGFFSANSAKNAEVICLASCQHLLQIFIYFFNAFGVFFFLALMESVQKKNPKDLKKAMGLCWPWPFKQLET